MKYILSLLIFISTSSIAQTTYYSDANGMPIGTAQRSGNTTYYSNANGMPLGTAQSPQQFQQAPMNTLPAPTFPTSPLFPSSPKGM